MLHISVMNNNNNCINKTKARYIFTNILITHKKR